MRASHRGIGLLAALLLGPWAAQAQPDPPADPAVEALRSIVEETASAVAGWKQPMRVPLVAGLAAGVLLLAAAAIRRDRCGYCQPLAAASGVLLCVLSLLANRELGRRFEERKLRAEHLLEQARRHLRDYDPTLSATDRRQWRRELLARLRQVGILSSDTTASPAALDVAATVSADSPAPLWVSSLPASKSNLLFVGYARNASLDAARQASLESAVGRTAAEVTREYSADGRRRSDPLAPAGLEQYIRDAAVPEETWFSYDPRAREFHYYTLLALPRMLARPDVVRAFVN
jgi:hypothetical protein